MAIRRQKVKPEDHFTIIANSTLRDYRLSLKARGLLSLIMSHRVGWDVTIETLARENPEGRDAVRSAVAELEKCGYLERRQAHDDQGRFAGYDYELAYEPPSSGFPTTDNPSSGNPSSGNPTQRRPSSKKTREKEDHPQGSAPDGDAPAELELALPPEATSPEEAIAKRAYDATDGALKFIAIKAIAKWALERKNATPERVEQAIADLHHRGKPVTRATVDQQLTGAFDRQPWRQDNNQRMAAARKQATRQQAALAALEGRKGQS